MPENVLEVGTIALKYSPTLKNSQLSFYQAYCQTYITSFLRSVPLILLASKMNLELCVAIITIQKVTDVNIFTYAYCAATVINLRKITTICA